MIKTGTIIQAEGFFASEKRWLFYRRFIAQECKGDFIIIHGGFEHGGRYEELGTFLAKNGYNTAILDLTGYGRSEGKRGYIHKFEDYLVDVANFYAFLQRHKKMATPILLGHSMGGLIATIFTAWGKFAVQGMVLSGPLFGFSQRIPFLKYLMIKIIRNIYPGFYLANPLNPNMLTHDEPIIEEYLTDRYIQHFMNANWIVELIKAVKKIHVAAPHINVPTLIFHGEKDTIANPEISQKFFSNLPSTQKEFYLVRGAYHEVFNEKGRGTLFIKLLEWLRQVQFKK